MPPGSARRSTSRRRPSGAQDVPVGALVVGPEGGVVGRGRNIREERGDPTGHAEVVALREAAQSLGSWRLDGCTLVVTLEPCVMCAGAAMAARVERVVFGAWDPKAGACGSVWDLTRDPLATHVVDVVGGVRERRSQQPCSSISSRAGGSGKVSPGGVSERPKEHASKACVGVTPPWVQIPPPPPHGRAIVVALRAADERASADSDRTSCRLPPRAGRSGSPRQSRGTRPDGRFSGDPAHCSGSATTRTRSCAPVDHNAFTAVSCSSTHRFGA